MNSYGLKIFQKSINFCEEHGGLLAVNTNNVSICENGVRIDISSMKEMGEQKNEEK